MLEIATSPCPDVPTVGAELVALRALVRERAREHGLEIGAAGTHPFARWEDQRVVSDDRYRGLIRQLGFVARQELVFGMHVHVGMADPEETIHVANGLRPLRAAADRAGRQLAAVAGRADGADVEQGADLPGLPARRAAAACSTAGRTSSAAWRR